MIFEEIAMETNEKELKEKYFLEAAETFAKEKSEYSIWKSGESYRELHDLFIKHNREKSTEYQLLGIEQLKRIGKNNIIGQRYMSLGELFEIDNQEKALIFFEGAAAAFSKVKNYKANLKAAKLKILICLICMKDTHKLILFLETNKLLIPHQKFCLALLYALEGQNDQLMDVDLTNKEEKELIDKVCNGGREEALEYIEKFKEDVHLSTHASLIFDYFEEVYGLEAEMC
ncbi:hypothetical protein NUSPORA_02877 [Nucleospora cyclopteri]